MGLMTSVGIGIGKAAEYAQPFVLNMQQAEIQKLRDDRMAEIAKGTAKYAADLELEYAPKKQAALAPGLIAAKEAENALEDKRRNDPAYLKGVAAEAAAKDTGAGLRAVQLKSAQLTLAEQEAANKFTPGEKEALSGYRKSAEIIETAIEKVRAEGGTPSQESLNRLADLQEKRMKLLAPHLPKTKPAPSDGTSLLDEKFPVRQPAQNPAKTNSAAQSESNGNTLSGVEAEINRLESQLKTGEGVDKPLNPIQGSMPWITSEKDIRKRLNELYQRRALGK